MGVNRRPRQTDKVGLGTGAEGVRDAAVDVLVADDEKGVPLARLFLHAAHAVALGSDNTMISADWPGAARRMVEAAYPGAVGLFMQGCCGNITCRERGWEGVESQGLRAAQAVAAGVGSQAEMPDLRVNGTIVPLALPLKPFPSVDRAEAALAAFTVHLRELPAEAHRGIRWMAEGAVEWAERILAAARTGQDAGSVPFDVQALQLGDVAIVGLPGEAFVEYALNIAADSPFAHTMVAAYANGNVGYIPTAAAHPEGGYEVNNAIRYYGLTMPRPEAEELILNAAAVALRELA